MVKRILKKKKLLLIGLLIICAIIGFCSFGSDNDSENQLVFTQISKGDLSNLVSCTGTLEAVSSVDVGSELSGTISAIFADYNDDVEKGQILAILDTSQLVVNLRSAKAEKLKAEAEFRLNQLNYNSSKELYKKNIISESELLESETSYKTAYASLISAETNYETIEMDIKKYSIIRSPIKGKVIARSIEAGQTVAASLEAPTLFTIAEDLIKMEIYAFVDESDIGQIKEGMKAAFTVETYPDETFEGVVRQVRLQPVTVSNVVTYTVVVTTSNESGLLLPGMTATIDFVIEEVNDAFLVSNSALNYQPNRELLSKYMDKSKRPSKRAEGKNEQRKPQRMDVNSDGTSVLWYMDDDEKLQPLKVTTGISDGSKTEIYGNSKLKEGLKVISNSKNKSSSSNGGSLRRPGLF